MFKVYSDLMLSEEARLNLKAEFDQLETIKQKYDFWKERFNYDYSRHYRLDQLSITDFIIVPKNTAETEEINKQLFENYTFYYDDGKSSLPTKRKDFFLTVIISSKNKENAIELELQEIDDFIRNLNSPQHSKKLLGVPFTATKSEWFFLGYEQYLRDQKEFDWTEKLYHPKSIKEISIGIEWAKYREFVKGYLKKKEKPIDRRLNGEQKFLVLYYLGFGDELKINTQKSVLFDLFIDELKSSSIRPMLSDVKKYETEENLYAILDYFRLIKFDSKVQYIQGKLDKLKKKR